MRNRATVICGNSSSCIKGNSGSGITWEHLQAAVLCLQLTKSCTDLDLTLLYILTLGKYANSYGKIKR